MNLIVKYLCGESGFRYMTFKSATASVEPSDLSDFAQWAEKKGMEVLSVRTETGEELTSGHGIPWSSAQWTELKNIEQTW